MNFEITKTSEVKVRKVEWLWYSFIPFGKVPAIQGDADDAIVSCSISAGDNTEKLLFINDKEHYLGFSNERLSEAIRATKAKLILLDPLSAYIGESISINSANEVRSQFRPLIDIAKEQGCAIVIVHHMNKAMGQKAVNRTVESVDIIGAARSVLMVAHTDYK